MLDKRVNALDYFFTTPQNKETVIFIYLSDAFTLLLREASAKCFGCLFYNSVCRVIIEAGGSCHANINDYK